MHRVSGKAQLHMLQLIRYTFGTLKMCLKLITPAHSTDICTPGYSLRLLDVCKCIVMLALHFIHYSNIYDALKIVDLIQMKLKCLLSF